MSLSCPSVLETLILVHAVPTLASLASPAAPMAGRASRLAAALVVLVLGAVYSASLYITCETTRNIGPVSYQVLSSLVIR